jgi:hypothetical protein
MPHILLLGAGFSRNWGGWFASEAFEYLLGCPEIMQDARLRDLLWKHQASGGFENALAELQNDFLRDSLANKSQLLAFQAAVARMFVDMNKGFFRITDWDPQNNITRTLLTKFDAIFTLNQDVFLDHHYLNNNIALIGARQWAGPQIPGMRRVPSQEILQAHSWGKATWFPLPENEFKIESNFQPFFKLHGSSNWSNPNGDPLLVMGGEKAREIAQNKILKWYANIFEDYLAKPGTRLMVIGYGFRDQHINDVIKRAMGRGLQIFIIAPDGAELAMKLNPTRRPGNLIMQTELEMQFQQNLIGASRRPLRDIFGGDTAEHNKVMRFFDQT